MVVIPSASVGWGRVVVKDNSSFDVFWEIVGVSAMDALGDSFLEVPYNLYCCQCFCGAALTGFKAIEKPDLC